MYGNRIFYPHLDVSDILRFLIVVVKSKVENGSSPHLVFYLSMSYIYMYQFHYFYILLKREDVRIYMVSEYQQFTLYIVEYLLSGHWLVQFDQLGTPSFHRIQYILQLLILDTVLSIEVSSIQRLYNTLKYQYGTRTSVLNIEGVLTGRFHIIT